MKCSRQGRAHHTKSGRLVCVFPRRLESPLRVGGDELECGNGAEGINLLFLLAWVWVRGRSLCLT